MSRRRPFEFEGVIQPASKTVLGSVFIVFFQLQPELSAWRRRLKPSSSDHSTAMSNSLNGGWQEGNMSRKLNQSFPAGQQPSSFFESPLWCGLADRLGNGGGVEL